MQYITGEKTRAFKLITEIGYDGFSQDLINKQKLLDNRT